MKVAVMGYGTVGSGVCEVIETHQDTLAKRTGGKALELARILDLREFPGDKHEALFTKDFNDILNDPEMIDLMEQMIAKCKKAGKPFGASIGVNYDVARFWMERGASFLSIGFPQDYYMTLGKEVIQNIRTIENERMV